MNFLRKISYSFPYKGAYGKRNQRQQIFYYMAIHFDIITFTRGDYYAFS